MQYVPMLRFESSQYTTETVVALCAVMLLGGLLSMLYGYRLYKVVVVVATGLAGAYVGRIFLSPHLGNYWWLAPLGLGLVGALVAISVQRVMVFLAGATIGFLSLGPVAAEIIWKGPEKPTPTQYIIVALAAFVVMGILSLLLFRPVVVVATSMFGATLVVAAMVHLVEKLSREHSGLYSQYGRELGWVFVAVTVAGVIFQALARSKARLRA